MNAKKLIPVFILCSAASFSYYWYQLKPTLAQALIAQDAAARALGEAKTLNAKLNTFKTTDAKLPSGQFALISTVEKIQHAKLLYGINVREINTPQMRGGGDTNATALQITNPTVNLAFQEIVLKGEYETLELLLKFVDSIVPGDGVQLSELANVKGNNFAITLRIYSNTAV